MEKAPMDNLLLFNIHIVIICALLLLTQGKSFVESSSAAHPNDTATSCIDGERAALVRFKAGLSDPANLLSSWKGGDCCRWKGVHCSRRNSHVVKLHLRGQSCYFSDNLPKLGGNISSSLLGLQHLRYLDLSCNGFSGVQVPEFLGSLHKLRYMDLSDSGLSGRIPPHLGEIIYMVNLDLSCNNLIGDIPEEISNLVKLKNLNLSWNNFSGKIPENIGALTQVESLDLSHNELSGEIPASLSTLTSLSRLNMSYNNLTGEVPSGNQLQTLEDPEYIYIGNPGLCGLSLSQKCSQPEAIPAAQEQHEDVNDVVLFFMDMGFGYDMGLWVVISTFLFKRKWRVSWYSACDSFYDWVYVQVAVKWASWPRENSVEAETGR